MSKGQIFGVGETQFKDDSGRNIHGFNLYYGVQEEKVDGLACDRKFFNENDEHFQALLKQCGGNVKTLVNKTVDLVFNRKGRIEEIKLLGGN